MKKLLLSLSIISCFVLSGCATSISELSLETNRYQQLQTQSATKSVYIRSVSDERFCNPQTRDPSVASMMCDNPHEKEKAIGRKRNGFGKALGGFILSGDQTVQGVTREVIEKALSDNGYSIVKDRSDINSNTLVIDVTVKQFWAWTQMGFWYLMLHGDVVANINLENSSTKELSVEGHYQEGFQTGMDSNILKVLQEALARFYDDAKSKFAKLNH